MTTSCGRGHGTGVGESPTTAWTEITLRCAPDRAPLLVPAVVRPLLTGSDGQGPPVPGFFVRGQTPTEPDMTLQLHSGPDGGSPEDQPGTVRARQLADALGQVACAAGHARLIPLTGSVFAGSALAPFTREVLTRTCPALLGVAAAGERGRPALLTAAAALMAAHLRGAGTAAMPSAKEMAEGRDGVPLGFLSYRSHAEAFVATSRDPERASAALARQYDRAADSFRRLVDGVLAQCEGVGPEVSAHAGLWFTTVRAAKPTATGHFRERPGERALFLREDDGGQGPADGDRPLDSSPFHRIVNASEGLRGFLDKDPAFLATRLLTSLLYLGLHSAGITSAERYFLCHAISRACEDLYDVTATAVLSRLARAV